MELCRHVGPYVARTVSARNVHRPDLPYPRVGNEAAWWSDAGIARKLWEHTRANEDAIQPGRPEYGAAAERTLESDIQALEEAPVR